MATCVGIGMEGILESGATAHIPMLLLSVEDGD